MPAPTQKTTHQKNLIMEANEIIGDVIECSREDAIRKSKDAELYKALDRLNDLYESLFCGR
ncbi:MAG: hypothetical protein COA43_00570 [Robiginitomaculum sp.]|nr:MAG: hypothetical protein COA43_00570 [Robiginitomaculum sp.]